MRTSTKVVTRGGMKWIYEGSVLSRMRGGTGHQRASRDRQEKNSCVKENVEYTVFFFSPKMTCDIFLFWTSCRSLLRCVGDDDGRTDGNTYVGGCIRRARRLDRRVRTVYSRDGTDSSLWMMESEFGLLIEVCFIELTRKSKKKERLLTSFHINPVDLAVSSEKPLEITFTSIILKVPAEHWPHLSPTLTNKHHLSNNLSK